MADVMGQEQGLLGDIDLDYLLQEFPDPSDLFKDDLYLDLDLSSEPSILDSTGSDSSDSFSSWANELEQFLLAEDGEVREEADERFHGNFFSGMSLEQSDELKSEVTTPEADDTEKSEDTTPEADGTEKSEILVVEKEEDEDPISKKRRRQMRSRDSAIKERRNLYIKDLEMKSGLLESERGRLDQVCRCFTAENLPLHHHLLKGRVFGALVAKQESALLLMGKTSRDPDCFFHLPFLLPCSYMEWMNALILWAKLSVCRCNLDAWIVSLMHLFLAMTPFGMLVNNLLVV